MADTLLLLVSAMLTNNVVLVQLLGMSALLSTIGSRGEQTAPLAIAWLTSFVLTLASGLLWPLYRFVLMPMDLGFLRPLVYLMIMAAVISGGALLLRQFKPLWYRSLTDRWLVISANSALLGTLLQNDERSYSFTMAIVQSIGTAAGFSLVLLMLSSLLARIVDTDVPKPFRGASIALVTVGLMSLAFMGFAGWN